MTVDTAAARRFVYAEGRVLEQRLYARLFEDGEPEGVLEALRGFRNPDGGFGHGLEPDKRCPDSQPLDVQVALETMEAAGRVDRRIALEACDWLSTAADDRGLVPPVLPPAGDYPVAAHWGEMSREPDVNVTLGVLAVLARAGIDHPWRTRAEGSALEELERDPPAEAHALRSAFRYLDASGGGGELRQRLAETLRRADWFKADAESDDYGVTPLEYPPDLFSPEELAPHLDRLERDQQPDGGWPISWQPPSQASVLEWRAIVTIRALRTLRAHGRL